MGVVFVLCLREIFVRNERIRKYFPSQQRYKDRVACYVLSKSSGFYSADVMQRLVISFHLLQKEKEINSGQIIQGFQRSRHTTENVKIVTGLRP